MTPAPPDSWAHLPFFTDCFPSILTALAAEDRKVYPPRERIFAALDACAPDEVRVVIIGQDPYHTEGKADGLAFSIPHGFGGRLASMGNILKELNSDLGGTRDNTDLNDWAQQGVLLLNTVLTVPEANANGHARLGWQTLAQQVLQEVSHRPTAFVLWGNQAQGLARHISAPKNGGEHLLIESAHPSPLSARRGFFGSRPFSRINTWLAAQGLPPIDWTDE